MTRVYSAAALAALLLASHALTWRVAHQRGAAAANQRHAAAAARALDSAVQSAQRIAADLRAGASALGTALQASRASERTSIHTVRQVIHEHPSYGAVRRPADLQRLRDAELQAITDAARAERLQR